MKKAGSLEETRNGIVHSVWGAGKDIDHITRIKTTAKQKRGLNFTFEEVSVDYLSNFVNNINELSKDVQNFYLKLIKTNKAINNPISKNNNSFPKASNFRQMMEELK